jgi:hypothetical protein
MPTDRMGPPPGASPPMRMTASWSGSNDPTEYKCAARDPRPMASSPRILNRPTRHRGMRKARLAVHHRSACSGVKALRNTSLARRQAAKLCYRFGPLTPSARSANLIAGDGTKNGFPAPNKEPAKTKNDYLTGKAPYRFESGSLQRRVACEPEDDIARPVFGMASFAPNQTAPQASALARIGRMASPHPT